MKIDLRNSVIGLLAVIILQKCYFIVVSLSNIDSFSFDWYQMAWWLRDLLIIISLVCLISSFYKSYQKKEFKFDRLFRLALYLNLIESVFYIIFILYSDRSSFFHSGILIVKLIDYSFVLLTIYYFVRFPITSSQTTELLPVSRQDRFVNWLIDTTVLGIFTFVNSVMLSYQVISNDLGFDKMDYILFFFIHSLVYYLLQEILFAQTIGKLHNESFVLNEKRQDRIPSIIFRTLARYIPFDAFSFLFSKVGWHDSLSGTTVKRVSNVEQNNV